MLRIHTAIGVAAAAFLLVTSAHAQQSRSADGASKKFITEAIQGDLAEVQVGELAQQKGTTDAVRNFGKQLVNDHKENQAKAQQVADDLGVKPPSSPSAKQRAVYSKLKSLSGTKFDRTFARDMVKDHEEDIKKFQKQASASGPTGDFAKNTLPTLRKHLDMAKSLTQQKSSAR